MDQILTFKMKFFSEKANTDEQNEKLKITYGQGNQLKF